MDVEAVVVEAQAAGFGNIPAPPTWPFAMEFAGRFAGTMCLSEPQAGSSLSDVQTRAVPDGADFDSDPLGPRYGW